MIRLSATISGLSNNETISIDRRNIVSLNYKFVSRSNNSIPSFGIISSSGSIEFKDLDRKIEDYANKGFLVGDLSVVISLENTITKKKKSLSGIQTDNWRYDTENRTANVSLTDGLEDWQQIQVDNVNLSAETTAYKFYESVLIAKQTPSKYIFKELDATTKAYLESIVIKYPYLDGGSLWSQWVKFCEAFGVYIYKNEDSLIVCSNDY